MTSVLADTTTGLHVHATICWHYPVGHPAPDGVNTSTSLHHSEEKQEFVTATGQPSSIGIISRTACFSTDDHGMKPPRFRCHRASSQRGNRMLL